MFYVKGVLTTGHNTGSHFSAVVRHIIWILEIKTGEPSFIKYVIKYLSLCFFCH